MTGSRARLFSNTAYLAASQGITILARLLYLVLLARMLGASGYGLLAYAFSWYVLFMPITSLGHGVILAREIASSPDKTVDIASATLSQRLVVSIGIAMVCLTLGWLLNAGREGQLLVVVCSLAIVPRALSLWSRSLFTAFERTGAVLAIDTIFLGLEVVIGISLVVAGGDLVLLAVLHVILWSLQALVSMVVLFLRYTRFYIRFRLVREYRLYRQGSALSLMYSANDWLTVGPVVIFREISDDTQALGLLAICCQALGYINLLPNAILVSAQPALRRSIVGNGAGLSRFTRAFSLAVLIQGALLAILLGSAGEELVFLLIGEGYLPIIVPLIGVCWIAGAWALSRLAQHLSVLSYKVRPPLMGALLGVTGMLLAILPLTAGHGFVGSIMASAFGIGVTTLWNVGHVGLDRQIVLPVALACLSAAFLSFLCLSASDECVLGMVLVALMVAGVGRFTSRLRS